MTYSITDRTIAIAGIYQAAYLVKKIANTGAYDEKSYETCIGSIFHIDTDKPEGIFEDVANIKIGLKTLISQLGGDEKNNHSPGEMQITKYVIGVMVLEKQLRKNQNMLNEISKLRDRTGKNSVRTLYHHTRKCHCQSGQPIRKNDKHTPASNYGRGRANSYF